MFENSCYYNNLKLCSPFKPDCTSSLGKSPCVQWRHRILNYCCCFTQSSPTHCVYFGNQNFFILLLGHIVTKWAMYLHVFCFLSWWNVWNKWIKSLKNSLMCCGWRDWTNETSLTNLLTHEMINELRKWHLYCCNCLSCYCDFPPNQLITAGSPGRFSSGCEGVWMDWFLGQRAAQAKAPALSPEPCARHAALVRSPPGLGVCMSGQIGHR